MHPLTLHSSATDQDWALIAIVNDLRAVGSDYISESTGSVKKSNECRLHSLVRSRHCLSGGNGEQRARVRDKGHLPDADRCLICLLCVVYVLLHYSFHARVDPSIQLKFVVKSCEIPLWHWKFVGSHQKCTPGVSYMTIDRAHPYEPCI